MLTDYFANNYDVVCSQFVWLLLQGRRKTYLTLKAMFLHRQMCRAQHNPFCIDVSEQNKNFTGERECRVQEETVVTGSQQVSTGNHKDFGKCLHFSLSGCLNYENEAQCCFWNILFSPSFYKAEIRSGKEEVQNVYAIATFFFRKKIWGLIFKIPGNLAFP